MAASPAQSLRAPWPRLGLAAAAVVAVLAGAWTIARPVPRRPKRPSAPTVSVPVVAAPRAAPPEPLEPIYGPPSPPPPIYGPPTPPSRVPLFDSKRPFNAPVLVVTNEDVRPADDGTPDRRTAVAEPAQASERLTAVGWERLDLGRGIPFRDAAAAAGGPSTQADARRSLFRRSAPDPAPVAIVYCLDPSVGRPSPGMLGQVRGRLRAAVAALLPTDRVAALSLDGDGTSLFEPWRAAPELAVASPWSRLDALAPADPAPFLPALRRAMAIPGTTHVVVLVGGLGDLTPEAASEMQGLARPPAARPPRVIALVVGDGTTSPRARALRALAVATQGAFAWLRPVAPAPQSR